MYRNKTFLAIIPARSGSKGIIDKNIREINHKPLMAYTVEACKRSGIFDDIVVSTDSVKYAEIAERFGASVPFLRPKELAADQASSNDVILHVINGLRQLGKAFDCFMLLQPTSPLRNEIHIMKSADILLENDADSVVSIRKSDSHSYLTVELTEEGRVKALFSDKKQVRRQDVPPEYRINGAIYLALTSYFMKHRSFYEGKTLPYLMNAFDSIDIDDDFQLKIAELLLIDKNLSNPF
ncbi:cytidylyltransferase domain-containing protein [Lacrimispora sphenoides]|uniref:N-acylneuraminate cytidylyltransferase/CMP-N,N'-diacetyllegionaminic acid synthase n=1 Tax=Lacrimispora sphenoides JCM 1415 TaxID=1297793 RepID=A0ABY1CAN4_9FIRM|nr:acylneuraminate cytidylyltransferase family protein [Lacrimispora sphenoides]SET86608.1 N-acylneuraminate cytidylyltransferase/CMP-N,N'-diacetyllegionaminic acid synthase [[Clostridium] sphenoides JCM 1415]SUY51890.1 N-acylneuraminate cytidylyltransferase [Lacrimispora sphenoides]